MASGGVRMKRPCEVILCHTSVWCLIFCNNSYFTDSYRNVIYAYDYDDGNLANRRIFVDAIAKGLPENTFCDGLCIDIEGCIWSCR